MPPPPGVSSPLVRHFGYLTITESTNHVTPPCTKTGEKGQFQCHFVAKNQETRTVLLVTFRPKPSAKIEWRNPQKMSRKALIAANRKMYKTPAEAKAFVDAFLPLVAWHTRDEIALFPSPVLLPTVITGAKGSTE